MRNAEGKRIMNDSESLRASRATVEKAMAGASLQ